MNEFQKYTTLKLTWEQVAGYLGNLISALLSRTIQCTAKTEDLDYWSIAAIRDRFSATEIISLIDYVNGGERMFKTNLPDDSNFSESLDMDLCQALLKKSLHLDWEVEMPREDCLWITGDFPNLDRVPPVNQNLIRIDSKLVDCSKLISKDELLDRLFAEKGTYLTLTEVCDENFHKWKTPLYWTYPISDSLHNGCYFILVKEGVLVISYDVIEEDEHEFFERESARMCTEEEMGYFIDEWTRYSNELLLSMQSLRSHLYRLEGAA